MGCSCRGRKQTQEFVWTSADGEIVKTYGSEILAKAAVIRHPGSSYTAKG